MEDSSKNNFDKRGGELMSRLTSSEIDESFGLFPPFHTDIR